MTTVYFVRHARPNYENHDDMMRELSEKGLSDRKLVTEFLADKKIDVVMSSPFKRAVDTVRDFAEKNGKDIILEDDFRERKIDGDWIEDFESFCRRQWADFNFKLPNGESLTEVQNRNIRALNNAIAAFKDKNIVIGSHGTALSTVINYYDRSFDFSGFQKIRHLMPWIVKFTFEDDRCVDIREYNLFDV